MTDDGSRNRTIDVRVNYVRLGVAVAAVAAVIWFALANRQSVTITWWLLDREASLIIVIALSAGLGAIAGAGLVYRRGRRR
jgi:uncharacterized integral membrane protein